MQMIPLHLVGTPVVRLRRPDDATVLALAHSIREIGLLHPVVVRPASIVDRGITVSGFHIVAGGNRVEACRLLGWKEIPATVVTLDELHCQLAEVDENLCGSHLSPSEEKLFMRRRKEIYEQINPETKNGGDRKSEKIRTTNCRSDPFTADTAAKTGKSKRTVERIIAIANELGEAVLTGIAGTSLDSKAGLKLLMETEAEERWPLVERAVAGEDVIPEKAKRQCNAGSGSGGGKNDAVSHLPLSDSVNQAVSDFWRWVDDAGLGYDPDEICGWIAVVHPGSPFIAGAPAKE